MGVFLTLAGIFIRERLVIKGIGRKFKNEKSKNDIVVLEKEIKVLEKKNINFINDILCLLSNHESPVLKP